MTAQRIQTGAGKAQRAALMVGLQPSNADALVRQAGTIKLGHLEKAEAGVPEAFLLVANVNVAPHSFLEGVSFDAEVANAPFLVHLKERFNLVAGLEASCHDVKDVEGQIRIGAYHGQRGVIALRAPLMGRDGVEAGCDVEPCRQVRGVIEAKVGGFEEGGVRVDRLILNQAGVFVTAPLPALLIAHGRREALLADVLKVVAGAIRVMPRSMEHREARVASEGGLEPAVEVAIVPACPDDVLAPGAQEEGVGIL